MYPREVRENAIEMIKNGKRVYSVARELGIPLTTVYTWAHQAGIKIERKIIPTEEIIEAIKKRKVATTKEISEDLGVSIGIGNRLQNLASKGKIKSIRLPKPRKTKINFKYFNVRLYFLDDQDFVEWFFSHFKKTPKYLKKVLTNVLTDAGIRVETKKKEKEKKVHLLISLKVKKALEKKAKEEGKTIEELLKKVVEV